MLESVFHWFQVIFRRWNLVFVALVLQKFPFGNHFGQWIILLYIFIWQYETSWLLVFSIGFNPNFRHLKICISSLLFLSSFNVIWNIRNKEIDVTWRTLCFLVIGVKPWNLDIWMRVIMRKRLRIALILILLTQMLVVELFYVLIPDLLHFLKEASHREHTSFGLMVINQTWFG